MRAAKWFLVGVSAMVLLALLMGCSTVPPTTNCAAMKAQAADSLAAVKVCQEMIGCNLTITDLQRVRAEVVAAARCE